MAGARIGIGWSTSFDRGIWRAPFYPKLRYAYRGPSFVAEVAAAHDTSLDFVCFDEALTPEELNGSTGSANDLDLLYIASHGVYRNAAYAVELHGEAWTPATAFAAGGPTVLVFDTCNLLNLGDSAWKASWMNASPNLRLVLGFASLATFAENTTRRGQGFGENIFAGHSLAWSWLSAVHECAFQGDHSKDIGVAIALGDGRDDAEWALNELRLDDLPCQPRTGPATIVDQVSS